MSARDDYPTLASEAIGRDRFTGDADEYTEALGEIDRLRGQVAAVNAALDQYRLSDDDLAFYGAVAKAVNR